MWLVSYLGHATFNVSPGFGQGIGGVVEDFLNYLRYSHRLKKVYALRSVSFPLLVEPNDLFWAYEMKGLTPGISRAFLGRSPNPMYSPKMMASFTKRAEMHETALNIGRFSFHRTPARESVAPAPAGGW